MIEELIFRSQQADLDAETERVKSERAARDALRLQSKQRGNLSLNQLIDKMYGDSGMAGLDVPKGKPSAKPEVQDAQQQRPVGRFPPPPSKR